MDGKKMKKIPCHTANVTLKTSDFQTVPLSLSKFGGVL